MVFRILRHCGGYTLSSLRKVTVRQFHLLCEESVKEDEFDKLRVSEAVRIAMADRIGYKRWVESKQDILSTKRKKRPRALSQDDLGGLGFEVK